MRNLVVVSDRDTTRNPRNWLPPDEIECTLSEHTSLSLAHVSLDEYLGGCFKNCIAWPNAYWANHERSLLLTEIMEERGQRFIGNSQRSLKFLNKLKMKSFAVAEGICTAAFWPYSDYLFHHGLEAHTKLFLKDPFGCNSEGIRIFDRGTHIADDHAASEAGFFFEEALSGTEITCCMMGNGQSRIFQFAQVMDCEWFSPKMKQHSMGYNLIPVQEGKLRPILLDFANRVAETFGLSDFARFDVIVVGSDPHLIDVNFMPGLRPAAPPSLFVSSASLDGGYSYAELIERITASYREEPNDR